MSSVMVSDVISKLAGNQISGTIILVVVAVVVRIITERHLSGRDDLEAEQRRRMLSSLRNALFFVLLVGLALIWAPSLRTFALSLTAFAVAIILATKELILCISGSLVKTTGASMRVGSWIEVNGVRGEVIDQTLMTTTIQELGKEHTAFEFTGRTIVIPNSVFLTAPVINERFFKRYVFHTFSMVVDANVNTAPIEKVLIDVVNAEMEDDIEVANRYMALIEKRSGLDLHEPEPRVHMHMQNDGKVKLSLRAFLPTKRALEIEQKAMRAGLLALSKQTKKISEA